MKRALLAAILSSASVAVAASDLFGVYLVTTADAPGARISRLLWPGGAIETVPLDSTVLLDASAIAAADVEQGPDGRSQLRLVLTADGARKLAEWTSRNVGRRIGIVVDGQLRSAPFVTARTANDLPVAGDFTPAEAAALAKKLGPPSVSIRPADAPNALRLDPVAPPRERGGWMIFRREGERLTIAFFDGFASRPADFSPAPKKIVLEFSRQRSR